MQHAEKTVHVAVTLEGVQNVRFESLRENIVTQKQGLKQ
jgi:hypothetical protein